MNKFEMNIEAKIAEKFKFHAHAMSEDKTIDIYADTLDELREKAINKIIESDIYIDSWALIKIKLLIYKDYTFELEDTEQELAGTHSENKWEEKISMNRKAILDSLAHVVE